MRLWLSLLPVLGLAGSLTMAGEPIVERRPPLGPSVPPVPEAAVAAASEAWQLQQLAARLGKPGTTGQQDVLFEILALCEEKPKAREDANLSRIVEYLLFEANLWKRSNLAELVFVKVPPLLPNIGARLLGSRLDEWLANSGNQCTGMEPWCWKDFRRIDAAALAAAVRRAAACSSKHNSLVKFWTAASLVALEDVDGLKTFAAAREALARDFPDQAPDTYAQTLDSMVNSGVRQALLLLLDEAEQQLAAPQTAENRSVRTYSRYQPIPNRLCQVLGWPQPGDSETDRRADLARIREWLTKNLADLKWDAATRRFSSSAPPPGAEALYQSAQAVEKRWNIKCLERITQARFDVQGLLRELVTKMGTNREMAEDPAIERFLLALVDCRSFKLLQMYEARQVLLTQVPKLNPKLGVQLSAALLRDALVAPESRGDVLSQLLGTQEPFSKEAFYALIPEFQKAYETARDKGDIEAALTAGMALLFVGGKPDRKEMIGLLEKGGPVWNSLRSGSGPMARWMAWFRQAGRPGYLHVLLMHGALDLDSYKGNYDHPLRQFQTACAWTAQREGSTETGAQVLAACKAWLDQNESKLVWDRNRNRFTGALPPDKAAIAESLKPLAAYDLKLEELLEGTRTQAEMAERLADAVLKLATTDAKAAKDPAVPQAIVSLMAAGKLFERAQPPTRLLAAVACLDRATAVQLWTGVIGRNAERMIETGHPDDRLDYYAKVAGDPTIVKEACLQTAAAYAEKLDGNEPIPANRRMLMALVCSCLGGNIEGAKVETLYQDYSKETKDQRLSLPLWAQFLCNTGNKLCLRLMLLEAKFQANHAALSQFGRQTGLFNTGNRTLIQRLPRDPIEGSTLYKRWLDENEKEFTWNDNTRTFDGPVMKLEELLPAPPERPVARPPVRPPVHPPAGVAPPRAPEEKPEQNF